MLTTTLRIALVAALTAGLASGCASVQRTGLPAGSSQIERNWAPIFLFGLAGPSDFDVSRCRNGVATIESKANAGQVIVSILSYGIYTPRTQIFTCAPARDSVPR